ncbi:MAG: sauU [Nitrososphaeraceae archaeon]|nr:sauU [Nitrososphaeraceae archaeon]MCD6037860.1 sauU [Nitrososphaeraceae archaeon]MDF2769918.1 sauU [Nitrososphaeraceae archaeon]
MVIVINRTSVFSLIFARILYSINWFNIASIFYFIASDFKQDISMLGLITSSFLIGIGIFQIPAGILAAKYGPRKIAIYGILITSSAAFLSGLSTDLFQMVVLRFIVGLGMACFFGPSVILISKYLGKESEGFGIGLLNSAHALGGIIGIFGWIILAEVTGWRISLMLSGLLGIVTGLLLIIALIREKIQIDFGIKISELRQILFNKSLIVLGLALLGFQIGSNLTLTFIVFYLADHLNIDPTIAGFVGSFNLIIALISSPLFGKIYDRIKDAKKLLIVSGIVMSSSMAMIAANTLYIIIFSIIIAGFFLAGGFVIVYTKAKQVKGLHTEYETLAVSYVNGISLFNAFWVPIVFSFIVNQFGYSLAWFLGGFITLLLVLPLFKLK